MKNLDFPLSVQKRKNGSEKCRLIKGLCEGKLTGTVIWPCKYQKSIEKQSSKKNYITFFILLLMQDICYPHIQRATKLSKTKIS